jgi:Fe/S biogenesis protein NfuA
MRGSTDPQRKSRTNGTIMIQLTDQARAKIDALVDAGAVRDPALRIALAAGADGERSPLEREYAISLVERDDKQKTEIAINLDGIRVLLNLDTSNLLSGAIIDWSDADGGFRVDTPRSGRPSALPAAPTGSGGAWGPLADKVQTVFDTLINPRIAAHGGAVELVDVAEDVIYVRMTGGCQGCAASALTLRQGIERMVREEIPEVRDIVDLTDHEAGVNPYY